MGCFFGSLRARDEQQQQHSPPTAAVRKAKVSQNPLSDLFVAREIEDFSSDGNSAPPEIVGPKSHDVMALKEVDSRKRPVQLCIPAKFVEDQKGLDSLEGTPTCFISGPPSAGRILADTTDKSPLKKHENRPMSLQDDLNVEGSLSAWLKPVQHNNVGKNKAIDELRTGRTPGDIPILGTVAAHWNDEVQPSAIPVKWWDGNGIPNSTTKYREDQKVSWHITPFEERLEKALSEEKSISQRKHINTGREAFQDNEIDTAASRLQSFPQPKSVVSC